ncbi:DUF2628 domain-containing protein [Rhizobium sp. LEGMi198b]|uniref:DUF2628 domain-containing protein n=1 Tax=unclassified Rhizobium TaxID=2613769 RepID=UPI000CDF42DC|nr:MULTISPECIES: DUF2628 domain-containing protein [Rhizobium]AVA19740.1 hypothetical protein NXC24_CH00050 [Rhizobium sp. NXC24]MDK4742773.1 DUF2628 domain-containing protein [Rhizobium sp. CNPSo 3464]UWU21052.1 DUF2628 domain-containing protein [Rhizobium tropici]WFU01836.1 DUF2628 domain-containing protein [Rhizobium sp. CB3171]
MASYLILTPPGGPDKNQVSTRFIRDGFSWTAFLFPTLWMLFHRLWLQAIAAFLLQGIALELIRRPEFFAAGIAILLGVHVLAALEGNHAAYRSLVAGGWKTEDLVSAPNLATAEEIHFTTTEPKAEENIRSNDWDIPTSPNNSPSRGGPSFGLPGYDGGR